MPYGNASKNDSFAPKNDFYCRLDTNVLLRTKNLL